MSRCHGTTKAGTRCKRPAGEGARYCAAHAGQAEEAAAAGGAGPESAQGGGPESADSVGRSTRDRGLIEAVVGLAAVGVIAGVLVALKRWL